VAESMDRFSLGNSAEQPRYLGITLLFGLHSEDKVP
jgi:hypothetical protein